MAYNVTVLVYKLMKRKEESAVKKILTLYILLLAQFAIAGTGDFWYIKAPGATVYSEPATTSDVVMLVGEGRKVVEFTRKGDWVNVGIDRSGGKDGWVKASQLSPTDPDGLTD